MKILIYVLPVSILVAYSQLIVKWRATSILLNSESGFIDKILVYFSDIWIVSAYILALLSSFAWLFVVTKLPLSIGFPVYIAITFLLVIIGSWLFLNEPVTTTKILSAMIILFGIFLGISAK